MILKHKQTLTKKKKEEVEEPIEIEEKFTSQQIKQAYGILNDPRYKQGNYSGAVAAINKLAPGLADHPDVKNALKRANEELEEASKYLRYSDLLIQKGRMQAAKDKQGERQTDIEIEKEKKKLGITDEFVPEADLKEFKKMVVTIADPMKRAKAMDDIKRFGKGTGFRIDKMSDGKSFRIDGQGADLNKFATDMKNFYGAEIKAESLEEAKTVGGALAQGHLEKMTDQRFKEFYGITKAEYIKKYGDPRKEELDEALEVKWDSNKQGWFDRQGKRRYLGKMATNKLMSKAIDKAKASGDWVKSFDLKHGQKPEETELKEGYESNMIAHLGELGIDVSFRMGKMIVYKRELEKVKDALRDGIADRNSAIYTHRMPDIKTFG